MIEASTLTKRYGTHTALNSVSFRVESGEILGLLGPNGAGKTTTMRILTGFMPPTLGTATIAGYDILEDSMEVRRQVGYMPERVPVYPDMTVEGYIAFWARLRGLSRPQTRVREVLERVHLIDRRRSLIRSLSKGMRQRLGLAQALVHQPQVVILDEPTIGIDPQQVIEVRESVRDLGKEHAVLFSTHILSEAEQVCDRVIILDKGHIVAQGKPDALRAQLQRGASIYVELGGAVHKEALKLLEGIPGVTAVARQGSGYTVRAEENIDIRPHIFDRTGKAGFKLLEMRPVAMTLEDIFLDIVGREF